MVPGACTRGCGLGDFPRIRGDGPNHDNPDPQRRAFSPYSRGWSCGSLTSEFKLHIFPVFAGMVPKPPPRFPTRRDFPRIRGDGPKGLDEFSAVKIFSPYSRGWSRHENVSALQHLILPVFAGMIPDLFSGVPSASYSPRIRGDDPCDGYFIRQPCLFSPYSRG